MQIDSIQVFSSRKLKDLCVRILTKVDVPPEEAELFANILINANLRGVDSHGVTRLPVYVQRLKAGGIVTPTKIMISKDSGPLSMIKGNHGIPHVVATRAMEHTVQKTRKFGVGITTVRDVGSLGALADYSMIALESNFVGVVLQNDFPSGIAPFGGRVPMMGTNPMSVSVPAGRELPIVLDMATSVAARGKILLAAKENRSIPEGWALDEKGYPTTDPHKALEGSVLPFGGAKGFAFALIIDILAGIVAGASVGLYMESLYGDPAARQDLGYFMWCMDVSRFVSVEEYKEKVDDLIVKIKNSPKGPGVDEIFLPGEIELRTRERRLKGGVPLSKEVVKDLTCLAKEMGAEFPAPASSE